MCQQLLPARRHFLLGLSLTPNLVFAGDADGTLSLSSNAKIGGTVYVEPQRWAYKYKRVAYCYLRFNRLDWRPVPAYGAQVVTATQTTGGQHSAVAPFNVAGNNIGALSTSLQEVLTSSSPVFGASATIRFKAKVNFDTPAETDYVDTVTVVAAMNY